MHNLVGQPHLHRHVRVDWLKNRARQQRRSVHLSRSIVIFVDGFKIFCATIQQKSQHEAYIKFDTFHLNLFFLIKKRCF
jgi:hypothetical protein